MDPKCLRRVLRRRQTVFHNVGRLANATGTISRRRLRRAFCPGRYSHRIPFATILDDVDASLQVVR
jgi:hypothetical protein